MEDELTGTFVLVHPQLPADPAHKQGQIGMITSADLRTDDFFVSFAKGEQALYASNALMVLKAPEDIYQSLLSHLAALNKQEIKALFEINLLQQYGQPRQLKTAMELVLTRPALMDYSMTTLEQSLGLEQLRSQSNEAAPSQIRHR